MIESNFTRRNRRKPAPMPMSIGRYLLQFAITLLLTASMLTGIALAGGLGNALSTIVSITLFSAVLPLIVRALERVID